MTRRKGGRPSKAALAERKRREKAAASQDKQRRWMEGRIKQGFAKVLSPAEWLRYANDNPNDPMDDVLLELSPLRPPWAQFVFDKVKGVPPERFEAAWCRALLDLLLTDLPLDKNARASIHEAALRLAEPVSVKEKREERIKLEAIQMDMDALERHGFRVEGQRMTPGLAYEWLAHQHGYRHFDAMRKWVASRRHLLDEK